jgi:hypothetical protein
MAPLTNLANGLAPNAVATVVTAGTAVSGTLPPGNGPSNMPCQLSVQNTSAASGTINIGTAAQIAGNPATPTFGYPLAPNGAITKLTIDPAATSFSVVLGAAGTGVVIINRGEGR